MLHAGGSQRMWLGVCVLTNLGAASGQMSIIPVDANNHTLGAIGVGMLTLLVFLICTELLFSIPALFFVYIAVIHDGGFASG